MTQVIVIRHGRTEWNLEEKFRGRADLELDSVGVRQAEATARRIEEWPISAIYSSPLRRTLTTAEILARGSVFKVNVLPGIIDIDYGKFEGLSPEEAEKRDDDLYNEWLNHPHVVKFPGGESLSEVRKRAALAVDELLTKYCDETIALVSHKVVCQILTLHFLGVNNSHFWQISQDVSAVNFFQVIDGIPHALLLNDTCHLKNISII